MYNANDPSIALGQHLTAVREIVAAGGTTTTTWETIKANYDAWEASTGPDMRPLVNAITGEKALDAKALDALRQDAFMAAVVAADQAIAGRLSTAIDMETGVALRNAYATVSASNYAHAADQYEQAVKVFAEGYSKAGDPNVDPVALVSKPKPTQQAWLELPAQAAQVDAALSLLATAGRLAGLDLDTTDDLIGLALDGGHVSPHLVRTAWGTTDARLGRWGALVERGVTLRPSDLNKWTTLDEQRTESISVQEFSRH